MDPPRLMKPTLEIVSRARWGSHPLARESVPLQLPVKYVLFCDTGTLTCDNVTECKRRVQQIQMEAFTVDNYDDIAHNFLIGGDGRVYEGCGWYINNTFGLALDFLEDQAIRIAYIGSFSKESDVPKANKKISKRFIRYGISHGCIRPRYKKIKFEPPLDIG